MITLVRYSYHELMRRWTGTEYVDRPFDGPHSIGDLVDKLESQLETKGLKEFVRPYLLFSWSDEDVEEVVARLRGKLGVTFYLHYRGNHEPAHWQPVWFYDAMEGDLAEMLDTARTDDDLPYLAYVEFSLG